MPIQYQTVKVGYEFKPTQKGTRDYYMDSRFNQKPDYKKRVPKHWLEKGWVKECRTSIIV